MARKPRTSIGLSVSTKEKLEQIRAIGQSYDGLLCELVLMMEKVNETTGTVKMVKGG